MDLQLRNRVAFVGGGSRGIGKAIAEALLMEGACVAISGREAASLEIARLDLHSQYPGKVVAYSGDMGDSQIAASALHAVVRQFGRIDDVVANMGTGAGIQGWDVDEEECLRLFNANLFASMRLARAAIPLLSANPLGGSIVFIGSITGLEASAAPLAYSAAKAALLNYSKNLACLLAAHHVRVNAVVPGNIHFEGGTWDRKMLQDPGHTQSMLAANVPQARFGTPSEIASLVTYLCSPLASFATGGSFVMDGGQTRGV